MRNVLAIFRKDVRCLWPQIALFFSLLVLSSGERHMWASWTESQGPSLGTLALLACCYLVAAAVLQEPAAGDRQYWLTRPFTARQLLAAKALFVAVFVNLAVLLTQLAILLRLDIPPFAHLDALFWCQVFLCAQILLPVAALCAATRSFTQFLLLALLVVVGLAWFGNLFHGFWTAPVWFGTGPRRIVLSLGAGTVLYLHYKCRSTLRSWILLGALAALFFVVTHIVWYGALPRTARISLDTVARRPRVPHRGPVEIPLRIEGIPPGAEAFVYHVKLFVAGRPLGDSVVASVTGFAGGRARLIVPPLPYSADAPLHLSGTFGFVLFQRLQSGPVPALGETVRVPGVGVCTQRQNLERQRILVCLAPAPRTALALEFPDRSLRLAFMEEGAGWSGRIDDVFKPVGRYEAFLAGSEGGQLLWGSAQTMSTVRTIAPFQGGFDFPKIRLADYPEPE